MCLDGVDTRFFRDACKPLASMQKMLKQRKRALKPEGSTDDTERGDERRGFKSIIPHGTALRYPGKRSPHSWIRVDKKRRTLCLSSCSTHFVSRYFSSLTLICTFRPVRNRLNSGCECAPLNFVMASAAFRLCGHHRGRHIALRMNSSIIGTSSADSRSS